MDARGSHPLPHLPTEIHRNPRNVTKTHLLNGAQRCPLHSQCEVNDFFNDTHEFCTAIQVLTPYAIASALSSPMPTRFASPAPPPRTPPTPALIYFSVNGHVLFCLFACGRMWHASQPGCVIFALPLAGQVDAFERDRPARPGENDFESRLDQSAGGVGLAQNVQRQKLGSLLTSFVVYSGAFLLTTCVGWSMFPVLQVYLRQLDPMLTTLNLTEVSQPVGLAITIFGITFGNLLSTTLGFNFSRLQSIRIALYDEAAQMSLLMNDLLILFKDVPAEREASFRRLLRHAKCTYYTTDEVVP